ncbi:response regulator [Antarcticirhabdus aurantiaca]|uniref:Response regulator n=2 Tax=Pseudomonadati TaxID=3379134 RepID=A0ACD4NPM8_9HYPH|nr:response regulator [Antarcticirhabdus aurantiaca]WAJ28836.1 response regulator [Jeongeuplla avenae]
MTPEPALQGLNGLVVEDNMIIALDAEQMLLDCGMANVFTAASVAQARRIIETEELGVALLDVNLGNETSFALVGDLKARAVPFVFVTGYGEAVELPAEASGAEAVKKPFAGPTLVEALARAATRAR